MPIIGVDGDVFPGVEELTPEMQDAIDLVLDEIPGLMMRQRCAMPDFARAQTCGWRHRPVTACIQGSLPGLTDAEVVQTYRQALDIWNQCANIGLVWTDNLAVANIWAKCQKIDGRSGTLAWSYLPPCGGGTTNLRLEQRYDIGEGWKKNWLLEVALHELGHALGLSHSPQKNSLMFAFSGGGQILAPTKYEIDIVVPLYGPPVTVPGPAPTTPTIESGVLVLNSGAAAGMVPVASGGKFNFLGKPYKLGVSPQ